MQLDFENELQAEQRSCTTRPSNAPDIRVLETLCALHSVGFWSYDRLERNLYLCEAAREALTGDRASTPPDLKELLCVVDARDRTRVRQKIRAALRDGKSFSMTLRVRGGVKQGASRATNRALKLSAQCDMVDGRVLALWGFVEDITNNRQNRHDVARLERSEARLMEAIQHMPDAFALYDEDDKLIFWNETYEEFYSASAPAFVQGASFEAILRYGLAHGQYLDAIGREDEWLNERLSAHESSNGEQNTQRLSNGQWLQVSETHLPSGGLAGFRVDVTAQKNLEERLAQALYETRAADQLQSTMLPNLAHELRTPLNAIIGFAQLLSLTLKRAETTDKLMEYSGHIEESALHLVSVMDNLFEIVGLRDNSKTEETRQASLNEIISKARRVTAHLARENSKRITVEGATNEIVLGDVTKLVQILLNLLTNAIKYSGDGQNIRIEIDSNDTMFVTLRVIDQGKGIPPGKRAKLFERYERLQSDTESGIKGSGLGLAIIKDFVEGMGGKIGVEDAPGGGAAFWVTLRRANPVVATQKPKRAKILKAG